MKFVDEFRDPAAARALVKSITELASGGEFKFMEVCGGHTHTIYRHGIEHLLPQSVELVHGPGCPVCVIPMGRVDDAMWLAEQPDIIFTTFGDMMRVPGSKGNLIEAKARGADVRFVYSPLDALKIAVDNPAKHVVFFAVGFETTAPSTAVTLVRARALGVGNFSIFCNHVTIVPPIKAILESPDLRLSGFLGPGHVSTVVGLRPYRFVSEVYGKPMVVAGFEPLDILASVHMLLEQIRDGRCEIENQYTRVVRPEGNTQALKLMAETFELRPHFEWRGLGFISQSASSTCRASASPIPRHVSAARSSRASSSRGSARCSALPARPRHRSARAWCHPRVPALPTTTSEDCTGKLHSYSVSGASCGSVTTDRGARRSRNRVPARRRGVRRRPRSPEPPSGRRIR